MFVTKMHGCGNDFCVIEYEPKTDYKSLSLKLCNRKTGIGSDGMIVVKKEPCLEMLYYNSDGSAARMNGNAIRCFSKYCNDLNLVKRGKLEILTASGVIPVEILENEPFMCRVNLGKPLFGSQVIYQTDILDSFGRTIDIDGVKITIYSFYLDVVNTVIFVNSFDDGVISLADKISSYKLFARGTNVSFVKVNTKDSFDVKTYEKGVGFVLASGAGCAAAVVAANKLAITKKPKVRCNLELGYLDVEINKKDFVFLTGPAVKVFTCNYEEEK